MHIENSRGVRPLEIDVERGRRLRVRWDDGHESDYPLALLRRSCPCATCRAQREDREKNPLAVVAPIANIAELTTVETADLVGNYAIRITWKDGHDTGIFDYRLLRSLCPCDACRGLRG